MNVMDSYWTMLPPEIHDFILLLKRNQETFEEERERLLKAIGEEIILYKKLKDEWALGHVRCVIKCHCCNRPRMNIYGCYLDREDHVKRERFLGYSFTGALQRLNHVKSFM